MNYGTPQEMIDEQVEYYESIGEKPPESGCLPILIIIIIVVVVLIIKKL